MNIKLSSFLLVLIALLLINNGSVYAHDCTDGLDNDGDGVVDELDSDCLGNWETLAPMPTPRGGVDAAVINGDIYVVGGRSVEHPQNVLNTVEKYNILQNQWYTTTGMQEPRLEPMVESVGDELFVIGGLDNVNYPYDVKRSAESYNTNNNAWSYISDIPKATLAAGSIVYNDSIFIIGGIDSDRNKLSDVQMYDTVRDVWVVLSPMPTPRSGLKLALVEDKLYAIGGRDVDGAVLNTIEVYDINEDTWSTFIDVPKSLNAFGVGVIDGNLFVYGGFTGSSNDDEKYSNSLYEYDFTEDKWYERELASIASSNFGYETFDGKLYFIGGSTNYNGIATFYNITESFTPSFSEGIPVKKSYEELVAELEEKVETEVNKKPLYQSYVAHIKKLLPFYEKLNYRAARNQINILIQKFSKEEGKNVLDGELSDELIELGEQIDAALEEAEDGELSVPLITQIASPYSPGSDDWEHDLLGGGSISACGNTIGECGCAITSLAMVGQGFGVTNGIDDTVVNSRNLNNWLRDNEGYTPNDSVIWIKAMEYLADQDGESHIKTRLNYEFDSDITSEHLDSGGLAIGFESSVWHYFTLTKSLVGGGFAVRDPFWYETKTTNEAKDAVNHVQSYGGDIDKAKLFNWKKEPKALASGIEIHLGSPAELLLVDKQGRKTGYDPETETVVNEIPNSAYEQTEAVVSQDNFVGPIHFEKVLTVDDPQGDLYTLQVIGTGEGEYDLTVVTTGGRLASEVTNYSGQTDPTDVDTYLVDVPDEAKVSHAVERLRELADEKENEQPEVAARLRANADRLEDHNSVSTDLTVGDIFLE